MVYTYPWQTVDMVDVYSDTDWAGCLETRKSTSGGCVMMGTHLIKSWSSTQTSVSLSSGESEFYGVVKAAGVGLGYVSLLGDVGIKLPLRVWTDSIATLGICGRQGLGKLRHIDTQCLWIQQRVRDGTFSLYKVRGEDNPADLFTKHLVGSDRIEKLLGLFGCKYMDGRPKLAPALRDGYGTGKGEVLTVNNDRWADIYDDDDDTVVWGDYVFPLAPPVTDITSLSNVRLPDAYPCPNDLLLHLAPRPRRLFPAAVACPALPEATAEEDDRLEKLGWKKGEGGLGGEAYAVTPRGDAVPDLVPAERSSIWRYLEPRLGTPSGKATRWLARAQARRAASAAAGAAAGAAAASEACLSYRECGVGRVVCRHSVPGHRAK